MPTIVLDFEISRLPHQLTGLDRYHSALCLFRHNRRPVARAQLPIYKGRLMGRDLRECLLAQFGPDLVQAWLEDVLGPELKPADSTKSLRATIAICTRDRPEDLRNCLSSLRRLPDDGQEVLVVDNASKADATEKAVRDYPPARYVREDRPGLDCARNRALLASRGDIVAFIDDDATADPVWLRALVSGFEDPLVMAVGGLTMPSELETEAQELFEKIGGFSRGFRRRRYSLESHTPESGGAAGSGVNMAFRRDVIEKVGLFDEALDAGTVTLSGGDTEMFARILAGGYDIIYEPAALNWHRHRRTYAELKHTVFGYGVGLYAAWTRNLFIGKHWTVLPAVYRWIRNVQIPRIRDGVFGRPGAWPMDLTFAELRGTFLGPWAYWRARRRLRAMARGA
ncbi:MAG TPA: glycosyltransferase [Prosthecobacter sp.]|nr:glycosyltransferase [Prosthecobacter sp.]